MKMKTAHVLPRIAREMKQPIDEIIPSLLAEHRTPFKVAVLLGVYPNTVRNWLIKNGYRAVNGEWVKSDTPELTA